MTSTNFVARERLIYDALLSRACDVEMVGRGKWEIRLDAAAGGTVDICLEDEWLICSAAMPAGRATDNVDALLHANGGLPGCCKVVLEPGRPVARLREDILLIEGTDVSSACGDAIAHIEGARLELANRPATAAERVKRAKTGGRKRTSAEAEARDTLEGVCTEAGWPYGERDGGQGVVTLDLPNGSILAVLEAQNGADYRVRVRLSRCGQLSNVSRRACAVFLLTINGITRFVRAGVERSAHEWNAFLESRFTRRPSPAALDAALSALSVASRLCHRETRAMGDDRLARRYLDARGMSPLAEVTSSV
jgi:hypothetical protein